MSEIINPPEWLSKKIDLTGMVHSIGQERAFCVRCAGVTPSAVVRQCDCWQWFCVECHAMQDLQMIDD